MNQFSGKAWLLLDLNMIRRHQQCPEFTQTVRAMMLVATVIVVQPRLGMIVQ